jgi:predicted nucleotidyltransferase
MHECLLSKRQEILKIAARHGVRTIRVFGSYSRGEASPHSDVDFLVEAGEGRSPFFPGGLIADLEDLLGQSVDVVEPEGLHWSIKAQVLAEAVPL